MPWWLGEWMHVVMKVLLSACYPEWWVNCSTEYSPWLLGLNSILHGLTSKVSFVIWCHIQNTDVSMCDPGVFKQVWVSLLCRIHEDITLLTILYATNQSVWFQNSSPLGYGPMYTKISLFIWSRLLMAHSNCIYFEKAQYCYEPSEFKGNYMGNYH